MKKFVWFRASLTTNMLTQGIKTYTNGKHRHYKEKKSLLAC